MYSRTVGSVDDGENEPEFEFSPERPSSEITPARFQRPLSTEKSLVEVILLDDDEPSSLPSQTESALTESDSIDHPAACPVSDSASGSAHSSSWAIPSQRKRKSPDSDFRAQPATRQLSQSQSSSVAANMIAAMSQHRAPKPKSTSKLDSKPQVRQLLESAVTRNKPVAPMKASGVEHTLYASQQQQTPKVIKVTSGAPISTLLRSPDDDPNSPAMKKAQMLAGSRVIPMDDDITGSNTPPPPPLNSSEADGQVMRGNGLNFSIP